MRSHYDILIIGAGPAGSVAATLLRRKGYQVAVFEAEQFPRFAIGESLLPQCMEYLAEAGLLSVIEKENFQLKDGALFSHRHQKTCFDFSKKSCAGPSTALQVVRADFDKVLADQAVAEGVEIFYRHRVLTAEITTTRVTLQVQAAAQGHPSSRAVTGRFCLDASGFGQVLPKLLNLERPSSLAKRQSLFTHIDENIDEQQFDRNKILIAVHPTNRDVWYWLIPFTGNVSSVGVVAEPHYFDQWPDTDPMDALRAALQQEPYLKSLLKGASFERSVGKICGYSSTTSQYCGERFALMGNAGGFVDPVFSSGVTIALKSALLAARLVALELEGQAVDWRREYTDELAIGIQTFQAFVESWYCGDLLEVIFAEQKYAQIREMICSVLAGYAWDRQNPYVMEAESRLETLVELCRG